MNPGVPFVWKAKSPAGSNAIERVWGIPPKDPPAYWGACKFWLSGGRCPTDDCPFVHHAKGPDLQTARKAWRETKKAKRHQRESEGHAGEEHHGRRAAVFADFLTNVYGPWLSTGTGVLDVAGGRGDLTVELRSRDVPSTLVEPRFRKLTRSQRKILKTKGITSLPHHVGMFDTSFSRLQENYHLLSHASVCVGLHPDQATEPIVELSSKFDIPFAVVPCCVFGREFPDRRLSDGSRVTSYQDFLKYLRERGAANGAKVLSYSLPLIGKNTVLYTLPTASSSSSSSLPSVSHQPSAALGSSLGMLDSLLAALPASSQQQAASST